MKQIKNYLLSCLIILNFLWCHIDCCAQSTKPEWIGNYFNMFQRVYDDSAKMDSTIYALQKMVFIERKTGDFSQLYDLIHNSFAQSFLEFSKEDEMYKNVSKDTIAMIFAEHNKRKKNNLNLFDRMIHDTVKEIVNYALPINIGLKHKKIVKILMNLNTHMKNSQANT